MKPNLIVSSIGTAGLLLGFIAWRLQIQAPPVIDAGILVDRSESMQEPCAALAGSVPNSIQVAIGRPGSTVTVFLTGDPRSANEPRLLLSLPSPARQRIFNGKQHQSEEERAFVQRIEERCRAVSTTRISPIYVGIQDAIEQLRVLQPQVAERLLTVISDLRENVDPRLRKALTQPLGTRSPLPQPVNNVGVTITLCGYAQTRANQSIQADRLIEVWTQLFTDPSRVSFGPFCPTAGEDIHQ